MIKVLANNPKTNVYLGPLLGGFRTALKLARLLRGQNQIFILKPWCVEQAVPISRRLMGKIKNRGGRKIYAEPDSSAWMIFKKLYLSARFGTNIDSKAKFEINHIYNSIREITGKEDDGLKSFIRELVEHRTAFGNDSSLSLLVNAVIDFRGDFLEEDRMVGLKIGDGVKITPAWIGKFCAIIDHPQTRRAFKDFIAKYHYGFTFPTRLASLTAVIANIILGRPAFNRTILERAGNFQCHTIEFDPHFGTILEEIGLKIPFSSSCSGKYKILDVGCGTSRVGSVTLKYLIDTLRQIFDDKIEISATGIDVNYPPLGSYPTFDKENRFLKWEKGYNFNSEGEAEVQGIKYLDGDLPQYNVKNADFSLPREEKFDFVICSMLLQDFSAEKQAVIRKNLFNTISRGGVLFLNNTSKEDIGSWETFEIWWRDEISGEMKALEQVIPFEEDPYSHKFQVDFIVEGESLLNSRQYTKRNVNLLYAYRREISHMVELAKKWQKRGSSIWKKILAAQQLAVRGETIDKVLLKLIGDIDILEIKDLPFALSRMSGHRKSDSNGEYGYFLRKLIAGKFAKDDSAIEIPRISEKGEIQINGLVVAVGDRNLALEAMKTSYFPNIFVMALALKDMPLLKAEEYLASRGEVHGNIKTVILQYATALSKIRAMASAFSLIDSTAPDAIAGFIRLLGRYSMSLFTPFRDEWTEILRLFVFSRFIDLKEQAPPGGEQLELKTLLASLADYLGNPKLSHAFGQNVALPAKTNPLIPEDLFLKEFILYQEEEGEPLQIKTLPRGTRVKDLKATLGIGNLEIYSLDWNFDQRKAIRSGPFNPDDTEQLKTGQIVVCRKI